MTILAVGDDAGAPPSVDVTVSVTPGSVMSSVAVYRNDSFGRTLLRTQPAAGFDSRTVTDYEAPHGEPVTYDWTAQYTDPTSYSTVWDEVWASLAAWTVNSGAVNVSGGKVRTTGAGHSGLQRAVSSGRRRVTVSSITVTSPGEEATLIISGASDAITFFTGGTQSLVDAAGGEVFTALDTTQPIVFDFLDTGVSVTGTGGSYFLPGSFDLNLIVLQFYALGANNVRVGEILVQSYSPSVAIAETSGSVTLDPDAGWLIHPSTPGLSFPLQLSAGAAPRAASIRAIDPVANPFNGTIHRILASARGVSTTNGPRDDDETGITVSIHTAAEEAALRALLLDQTPILVNISPAKGIGFAYGFYQVLDTADARLGQAPNMPFRSYRLPMIKVDSPAVTVQGSRFSWAQLALDVSSWSAVKTDYPSWADVQANTPI